jgi:glycosyltransferase involved in cell wall biosynthesis
MKKKIKKIAIISTSNPFFLGGISLYITGFIKFLKDKKDVEIYWIYSGKENKQYKKDGVNFFEIRVLEKYPLDEFIFSLKILNILKKERFDIINSHAQEGFWMNFYKKENGQRLIHTYHGVTYDFFKVHLKRFSKIKKTIISPILIYSYIIEKPPWKKADRVICVSEHVKDDLDNLYGKRENVDIIRTGVNLKQFKPRKKDEIRKKLGLEDKRVYGLYVGRGGYWRKGLDRAVSISEKIYDSHKNYRLIAIGPDYKKVKHLINKPFIKYIEKGTRELLPFYYSACDFFFSFSRYEGGAPTLVTSEAMASGCFVLFSRDSQQEIIKDGVNGLIINNFGEKEADEAWNIFEDKQKLRKIIKNSIKTIKSLSLEKWGRQYLKVLFS